MKFIVYAAPGASGLFLTKLVAAFLGINFDNKTFSKHGHAHDFGSGNWNSVHLICLIGNYWVTSFKKNANLYYTHVAPKELLEFK